MIEASKAGQAVRQTAGTFARVLPVLVGVMGLAALATAAWPPGFIAEVVPMRGAPGALLGAGVGGVAAGHPLTSYVLGGEFLGAGAGLAAVTAFVVSWVTVSLVHLPAEAAVLGLRFALWRNGIAFAFAIAIGYLVAALTPLLP